MSKYKIEPDEKIRTVEVILNGKETQRHAAARLGVAPISVQQWIAIYQSDSSSAFTQRCYKRYPKELKEKAVLEYLNGNKKCFNYFSIDHGVNFKRLRGIFITEK